MANEWSKVAAGVSRDRPGMVPDYVVITDNGDVVICVAGRSYGKSIEDWWKLAKLADRGDES